MKNLIIIWQMFNLGTDDLAIPHKVYFNEFVANALRDNMGIIILAYDLTTFQILGQNL